jgi:alkylation response protein AidB-like acyl-CoA dehydrogenase
MLIEEVEVASRVMPGLVSALSATPMMDLEDSGAAALAALFRAHGEPGFLVPADLGGRGGSLLEMVHVLRVVGARCPSLSIMMTMHHHVVAAFACKSITVRAGRALLRRVATERALVASAFAEGRPGADVLDSTVQCSRVDGTTFSVVGAKKPCTMTHHANVAVVGVCVDLSAGAKSRGIAVVDTSLKGIGTRLSWPGEILASADSHCLVFDGVVIPADHVLAPKDASQAANATRMAVAHGEIGLSCLFQILVSASYLGMASRLCEIALKRRGGTPAQRVEILSWLETAAMAVYRLAQVADTREISGYLLGQSMLLALNAAAQIERAVSATARALGGGAYLSNREAQYLVLTSRCLEFHLPSAQVREQVVEGCYTDLL